MRSAGHRNPAANDPTKPLLDIYEALIVGGSSGIGEAVARHLLSRGTTDTLMWIDAFARDMIPFHLTTVEFFGLVRAHLNPGGVVAVNLASSGREGDLARASAVVQTMNRAFPVIQTFPIEGPWKTDMSQARNLIFFGGRPVETASVDEFVTKVTETAMNRQLPIETIALLSTRRTDPWPPGVELTDDFAPYDLLIGKEGFKEQMH